MVNIKRHHHTLSACFPTLKMKFSLSKSSNICKSCQMLSNSHEILLCNCRATISSLIIICISFLSMMPNYLGLHQCSLITAIRKVLKRDAISGKNFLKVLLALCLSFLCWNRIKEINVVRLNFKPYTSRTVILKFVKKLMIVFNLLKIKYLQAPCS